MNFFQPAVNFINRLRYPKKLMLLWTIVVCIVLALFSQLTFDAFEKIKLAKIELFGVALNDKLIVIFEKIQQYRNLEYTDSAKNTEREQLEIKAAIVQSINEAEDILRNSNKHFSDKQYLEQFETTLSQLKEKVNNPSNQHGMLADVKNMIISVCDASALTLDAQIDTFYLSDSYCTKFPDLSLNEALIRELGKNILANNAISATDQNKLYALNVLMKEYNLPGIVQNQEKIIKKNPSLANAIEPMKDELMLRANLAMLLLENTLLNGKLNIEQEKFINQYTNLLNVTYKFHKQTGETLANLLNTRIQELKKAFYIELTIVISVLFIFFYLFVGIYLSIIKSIAQLVNGTQKIAKGSLSEKVELETHDELSEIASNFNEMREMLLNVVQKLHEVVTDANKGQLNNIINLSGAEGFYKDLFNEINQMTGTFNDVIVDLSSVLDYMSKGNLTKKMGHHYEGSFEDLKTYMNHTVESLEELLREIKTATEAINHSIKEIVLGNNDLAKRTDQQAAALEETSTSMEKITNTVKQNTENAKGVNDLAKSTSIVALKGGAAVNQVVEMMNSINENIHEVSEISNVIDNIAFQTNILALNASVEAARAGDQGRGFSVVATEIRNLALRSSDSAKDIKTLINTTVERITHGAKLVDEAGQTITEVVSSVNNVTDIMSKMADSSIEQSHGIEQIYVSINQIDLVTQQNSALVEEAARASESLEQQIKHVDNLVDVFTVTPESKKSLAPSTIINQNHEKPNKKKTDIFPMEPDEWDEF